MDTLDQHAKFFSVTVLEIATSTTNCGTTTAPVGLCMGRRRRRESPFIDAHEYRSKMTAETLSEPILPDKVTFSLCSYYCK